MLTEIMEDVVKDRKKNIQGKMGCISFNLRGGEETYRCNDFKIFQVSPFCSGNFFSNEVCFVSWKPLKLKELDAAKLQRIKEKCPRSANRNNYIPKI